VIAFRLAVYILTTWGTLELLASGLFPGAQFVTLGLALFSTIPIVAFALWRGWPFYPDAAFRLLVVRPFWYTQLLLPLVSAAGLLGLILGAPFGEALLVGRIFAGIMLATATVLLVLGYLGTRRLVVRRVDAEVPDLPAEFDGLRIVQLSDLHIGPHTNRRFLQRVVNATRGLQPDIIAVTGDLIDDRAEDVAVYARALGSLEAPLGVYMIPGNHDVYAGWEEVEESLRDAHLGTVLVNDVQARAARRRDAGARRHRGSAGGRVARRAPRPTWRRALARVPASATTIAFAHNPALWPALAARGVALTLSGHTHWGSSPCRSSAGASRRPSSSTRWARTRRRARCSTSVPARATGEFPSGSAHRRRSRS
jgi:predicted MPP superfamily phosphohydrolase